MSSYTRVKFEVLELIDMPKQKSEIKVGGAFWGDMDHTKTRVFFLDKANCAWCFYVGDTCKIIES
jgi:hypothetical protein